MLRVRPPNLPQAYSITSEGISVDIVKNFADVFSGVGKLKNCQLKLHVNKDVKPVAQPVRGLPFGLRDKVDKKPDELLKEDIIIIIVVQQNGSCVCTIHLLLTSYWMRLLLLLDEVEHNV